MRFLSLVLLGLLVAGCDKPVKEQTIEIKVDPLNEPRTILKRYAEGQPLGSEVSNFSNIVNSVRQSDPAKAEILESGFAEIEKAKGAALKSKAKEILNKLGS